MALSMEPVCSELLEFNDVWHHLKPIMEKWITESNDRSRQVIDYRAGPTLLDMISTDLPAQAGQIDGSDR